MVMNKKIVVRDSGIAGKGLYVVEKITKGEVVRAGGERSGLRACTAAARGERRRRSHQRTLQPPVVALRVWHGD